MDTHKTKHVYIETLGCQMNKLDSELLGDMLSKGDFLLTENPEESGIAILNTCSVRRHAELKALSRLGRFDYLRRRGGKPEIIAVIGCFAQRSPEYIQKHAPFVDIICGPNRLHELPMLIGNLNRKKQTQVSVDDFTAIRGRKERYSDELENLDTRRLVSENQFQAYVRIQRGCDKFCSYCIVPNVRGPEVSRPPDNIIEEIMRLDDAGCKEVTLIGQTVNSYLYESGGRSFSLADLLYAVHSKTDIPRIRFVTSYPADFSTEIFHAMAELPRVCPYLHIPAQHGSNRMLELMKRRYTVEQYLDLIAKGRGIVPNLSVAGDFIVGFPGEREEDQAKSVELIDRLRYKNCFLFKYSERPGTLAEKKYDDEIADEVKTRRLSQLLELQNKIAEEDNRNLRGSILSVLVEGVSKKNSSNGEDPQLVGRTVEDKIVVFDGPLELRGKIVDVAIGETSTLTLFGKWVKREESEGNNSE